MLEWRKEGIKDNFGAKCFHCRACKWGSDREQKGLVRPLYHGDPKRVDEAEEKGSKGTCRPQNEKRYLHMTIAELKGGCIRMRFI